MSFNIGGHTGPLHVLCYFQICIAAGTFLWNPVVTACCTIFFNCIWACSNTQNAFPLNWMPFSYLKLQMHQLF